MSDLNLFQRLNAMKAECKNLHKDGHNSFHGFAFVSHDGLMNFLRDKMAEHGVAVLYLGPSKMEREVSGQTRSGAEKIRFSVWTKYLIANADNPEERFEATGYGEAIDQEDKGHSKAITSAHKYFYMKLFDVSGGDEDPDAHGEVEGDNKSKSKAPPKAPPKSEPKAEPKGKVAPTGESIGAKSASTLLEHLKQRDMLLRDLRTEIIKLGADSKILAKMPFQPADWPAEYKPFIKAVLDKTPLAEEPTSDQDRCLRLIRSQWDRSMATRELTKLPPKCPTTPEACLEAAIEDHRGDLDKLHESLIGGHVTIPEGFSIPF